MQKFTQSFILFRWFKFLMPLWSIAEWRARIGSSWCALGRPLNLKTKLSVRHGARWLQRVLTLNQVVTMITILIMFVGVNIGLRKLVTEGAHHVFTSKNLYRHVTSLHWAPYSMRYLLCQVLFVYTFNSGKWKFWRCGPPLRSCRVHILSGVDVHVIYVG